MTGKRPGAAKQDTALTVFNLFLKTARAIMKEADRRLEKSAGVSASTYIVLMSLEMNRGTIAGSSLAKLTGTRRLAPELTGSVKTVRKTVVGDSGFEPETPVLSGLCSNQLS